MRICIAVNCWKRSALTKAVFKSWRVAESNSEHTILIRAVLSPDDPEISQLTEACFHNDVRFTLHDNQPMGAKANARSRFCSEWEWDYMMVMGSDDLISPNFFDAYEHVFDTGMDAWGWADCYFYEHGKLYYWPGYGARRKESIGAGRMLHRSVLECCNWHLWDDNISRNMDKSCTDTMRAHGFAPQYAPMRLEGHMLIDVKDDVSITSLASFGDTIREVQSPAWLKVMGL